MISIEDVETNKILPKVKRKKHNTTIQNTLVNNNNNQLFKTSFEISVLNNLIFKNDIVNFFSSIQKKKDPDLGKISYKLQQTIFKYKKTLKDYVFYDLTGHRERKRKLTGLENFYILLTLNNPKKDYVAYVKVERALAKHKRLLKKIPEPTATDKFLKKLKNKLSPYKDDEEIVDVKKCDVYDLVVDMVRKVEDIDIDDLSSSFSKMSVEEQDIEMSNSF